MLKRGFTLAEVLITLMIIGVVATLTTPALVKNVGSSKIGPQLSKFVNTWETAVESMMMEENVNTLSSAGNATFDSSLMDKLSRYMIMASLKNNSGSYSMVTPNGTSYVTEKFSSNCVWQLKDGTIIMFKYNGKAPDNIDYKEQGAYKSGLSFIYVDIGGIKGSHRLGKEVFGFIVDDSGILVPYGSNAHKTLVSSNIATCSPSSNTANSLLACTGAIADNGYKAPW